MTAMPRLSCTVLALLAVALIASAAAAPVASFAANRTIGAAPLTVAFTDTSAGTPTGWAWYFGDGSRWLVDQVQDWNPRLSDVMGGGGLRGQSAVVLANGSLLQLGGFQGGIAGQYASYVIRSPDGGLHWDWGTSANWSARADHGSVALPDGSIVLTGGYYESVEVPPYYFYRSDVWRSADGGVTWTCINADAPWSGRARHATVAMPDGSILLMGGEGPGGRCADVWRSTDGGSSWVCVNVSPGWSARGEHVSVVLPDGTIVLAGGWDTYGPCNDVWSSGDGGVTWTCLSAGAPWQRRCGHSAVVLPDGTIVLMGGLGGDQMTALGDVWCSFDRGVTWDQGEELPSWYRWANRWQHSSVVLADGSIVLLQGTTDLDGTSYPNDIWSLSTAHMTTQHPLHTFAEPGTYTITLSAWNGDGRDTARMEIRVVTVLPVPPSALVPTDPDGDGVFDDVNGNGRKDFADVVLYFNAMAWIAGNEPVVAFDSTGNGRVDFGDVVRLFNDL